MNSRSKLALACLSIALLAGVLLGAPATALAATKGTGGWYWPTGTEKLGSWDGYWVFRPQNHSWHMAKDIATPNGHPVYAIADGVVAESSPNSGYGGVLVIWHKTGAGQKFLTIYGHIARKNLKKGDKVVGGQVIGAITLYSHLHFGIHPGNAYPPDGNPFRGHTYDPTQTYGWVDPIKFLKEHPAALPSYSPPALPQAAWVSCSSTPTVLGVASGSVYWRMAADDESHTVYVRSLKSGETTELAEDAALPTLDTTRYLATTNATCFKLFDRAPVLKASFSAKSPEWKHAVVVSGKLSNAAGKGFNGATVVLERSNGGSWVKVASSVCGAGGAYSISFVPTRSIKLRVKFVPPSTYITASTAGVVITPKPGLRTPSSAKQAKPGAPVKIAGVLAARHPEGKSGITLRLQQHTAKGWTDALTIPASNGNGPSGTTRYEGTASIAPGAWRVSATCVADSQHAAQSTGWLAFSVK